MANAFRLEPLQSRFTVRAFATGVLSIFGHSPTFAVGDFGGTVRFEGGRVGGMVLRLAVQAESLTLTDNVSAADRREIEEAMRRDVLETAVFPEVRYEADSADSETVAPGRYRVAINARLSLHGVTRDHPVAAELVVFDDGIRLRGESRVSLSQHHIRAVTALGGTIRLKDELQVTFVIAGLAGQS
jgi:polyisoprenoid-binding protein YceI